MAATSAAAATFVSPSSFGRRNIASSSFSYLQLRLTILPPRFAPLVARPTRFSAVAVLLRRGGCVLAAASAAGAGSPHFGSGENDNPYEILGISPLDGFDQVKMAYKWRRKNAENSGDAAYLLKLQNRKKGVAYGSVQVSKDIKYADNQPIVPWGPRYSRATAKDVQINMAISATFTTCILTMGHADWKPLQFLCFAYFYRILEKLKSTEPAITPVYNEYGEVEGRGIHMAKRVLRSLGLVVGSIFAASLGYTGVANFSQFLGHYIPSVVYNFQVQYAWRYVCIVARNGFNFLRWIRSINFIMPNLSIFVLGV
ncbi:protein CHLOROPLAST J-LIKE DOMAIN 1, chloroplastic isoform X1 [Aegilops tauschii subsp. strangulata]|uniref:protein CHLOROPLAST J-LIKE DOMAIN 1, chloroplastic isoform X1 n=1 Tax=Aegilops tauschii subsp. strangulata TaxID=200361 RepID=UPI001ABCAB6C|nr:uncharacterized protein LOC109771335 isoform X2 [Aegilops tauschii subsp. strangulata]